MHFRSIADLGVDVYEKLLPKLPRDIEVVFGIPRSGMLVASMLSTALGVRLGVVGENSHIGARGANIVLPKGCRVLIVDDSIHTGRAMQRALLSETLQACSVETCAVYAHSKSVHLVDHYASILDGGRIFQWNFTGTKASREFCWDLDGVICTNPSVFDDDGEAYQAEIRTGVRPLHLPQVPVKAIITNRLERWRGETEHWLENYGVKYSNLIMQPYRTAAERRKCSLPEEFKASQLVALGGTLFVESSDKQAAKIAMLAKIPVISTERMRIYT